MAVDLAVQLADERLPRPDARALAAWLSASQPALGPFAMALAPPLAPPPPLCRVLAPSPVAVAAAIALGRALGSGSELLLLLSHAEWAAALAAHAELQTMGWVETQRAYEPPWYQQASAIHPRLLAPLRACEARPWGVSGALIVVCLADDGLLDPRTGVHVLGLFDRAFDRGGFARCSAASRGPYVERLCALLAPGARALVLSAERAGDAGGRCGSKEDGMHALAPDDVGNRAAAAERAPKRAKTALGAAECFAGDGSGTCTTSSLGGIHRCIVPASTDAVASALALGGTCGGQAAQLVAVQHLGRSLRLCTQLSRQLSWPGGDGAYTCLQAERAAQPPSPSPRPSPSPLQLQAQQPQDAEEAGELWCGHTHLLLKAAAGDVRPPIVPACPCCR